MFVVDVFFIRLRLKMSVVRSRPRFEVEGGRKSNVKFT